MIRFPRTTLARYMADEILGLNPFSDAPNGLFLAAPRRTGKSTFLLEDLKPLLESSGVLVVYVDLWADKTKPSGKLIEAAIYNKILEHMGALDKGTRATGIQEFGVPGFIKVARSAVDPASIEGLSLTDAFRKLRNLAKKPIVLIVDEAQQSLVSEEGDITMKALKSARDQMKNEKEGRLSLVMSGSDRDKLLRLVNMNSAPFLGSNIREFPLLKEEYIDFIAGLIEKSRPDLTPLNREQLNDAFKLFGSRPQFFQQAVSEVLSPLEESQLSVEEAILGVAQRRRESDEKQMESDFMGMAPMEQVVLWRLLEKQGDFKAYDADALAFYTKIHGVPIVFHQAQAALDSLREREPPMVWKSQRGEYAVEDAAMHDWYNKAKQNSNWPPGGSIKPMSLAPKRGRPKNKS